MKNLKNMFAWITLAIILTVGTVGANAGIIIVNAAQCAGANGGLLQNIAGIIYTGAPQFAGILISDKAQPCLDSTGILISD